jgi:CubicO group peptidase (beta-lactamase class C family)
MTNSGYDHFDRILPHRATGYSRAGDRWENSAYIDMSVPSAAGALYSTVEDFFLWYQCWREHKILSESSWKAMTTPTTNNHGFGIRVSQHFGHRAFEHGGAINGFASFMSWFPEADLFICAFGNADSARSETVVKNLAAIRFNQPVVLPRQRTVVQLSSKQIETLVGRYELKTNFILTVTASNNRFFVQATRQSKFEFLAESETRFFGMNFDVQITFCRGPAGKVTHLVLHQNGDHVATRLKD